MEPYDPYTEALEERIKFLESEVDTYQWCVGGMFVALCLTTGVLIYVLTLKGF